MFKLSRMKSLVTLAPAFSNSTAAAPFASQFHCQPAVLCRTTNSYAYHCVPSVLIANCITSRPKLLNYNQNRKIRTQSGTSGEIHVIVGPMFAGKTTTLLKRMKLASSNGSSVAIIKSDKDNRYAVDSIVTHDGEKLPCVPLANLSSFREKLGIEAYENIDVIGIDEAQFFGDLYEFCCKAADRDGKTLIVAGLDGDYLRRSFGSVLDIIPIADSVTKLTARCEVCNKPAVFTLRKTSEIKTELIAGADVYMPVCRKHYTSGQMVKDATKAVIESQNVQISSVL